VRTQLIQQRAQRWAVGARRLCELHGLAALVLCTLANPLAGALRQRVTQLRTLSPHRCGLVDSVKFVVCREEVACVEGLLLLRHEVSDCAKLLTREIAFTVPLVVLVERCPA
jgi:hypothetical protein